MIEEIRKISKVIDDSHPLEATTLLLEEGLLTSLELLELVLALESALSTSIPLEELTSDNFETVNAITDLLKRTCDA